LPAFTPRAATTLLPLLLFATHVRAATFTTTDVSSYVNSNVEFGANTFPTGTTNGNQGTGIPFDIATYNGIAGNWSALYSSGVLDVKVNVSGQASFYALLNNYYGTPGADEYDITIKATNGDSVTYESIGGVDTRDYNAAQFTNGIANTTFPWFNNGIGQRLDLREFNLPASFANETVSDFIITQRVPHDSALFTGLTFSTEPYNAAPEPMSAGLLAAGAGCIGLFQLRRRRVKQTRV